MKTYDIILAIMVLVFVSLALWFSLRVFTKEPVEKIDYSPRYTMPQYEDLPNSKG